MKPAVFRTPHAFHWPLFGAALSATMALSPSTLAQAEGIMQQDPASEYLASGGSLDAGHHAKLTEAWSRGCAELSPAQRTDLRTLAPDAVRPDLAACP